jgi:hypothetical protein
MSATQVMDLLAAERTNNAAAISAEVDRQMAVVLAAQAPPSAVVPPPFTGEHVAGVHPSLSPGPRPGAVEHTSSSQGLLPRASASTPARGAVVVDVDADEKSDDGDDDDVEDEEGPVGEGTFNRESAGLPVSNALNPVLLAAPTAASTKRDARPPPASFYLDRIAPPEGMGSIADSQIDFASEYRQRKIVNPFSQFDYCECNY